jgi:type II secretory pathway pseudopilin PulG
VVIAIIGLLSTIIAAPIQNARKKAKDAKKVAEMDSVRLALDQYAEANSGNYPAALATLVPVYMPVLPSWASTTVPVRDRLAYVTYTATPAGSTVAQVFGYHMGIHLDVYNTALDNDRDCTGSTAGITIGATSCVWFNTSSGITAAYPTWATGMIGTGTLRRL